jgi:hypothetical protein
MEGGGMISRVICIFTVIIILVFVFGYSGKSSQHPLSFDNSNDADLVQVILSCPCKIGPLGVIAGRSYSEKNRETALNVLRSRYPDWHWELIDQKRIKVGMNEHELRLSWGNPYKIHCSDYGEQWVHVSVAKCLTIKNVYVESGHVAAWN